MYLSVRHLVISVLISWEQELSENIWFVWPKNQIVEMLPMRDKQRTKSEDSATQLLICETLSLAIKTMAGHLSAIYEYKMETKNTMLLR